MFIWQYKFFADASMFIDNKTDSNFCLYVDNQGLNNLTIKHWYPLQLIGKSLDRLGWAKQFTQLDLISAYHLMRIQEGDE